MKEGGLWKEWKEQRGEIAEPIENIRIERGDEVGVNLNERGDLLMKGKMNFIENGDGCMGGERSYSFLRFENSPDGRDVNLLE